MATVDNSWRHHQTHTLPLSCLLLQSYFTTEWKISSKTPLSHSLSGSGSKTVTLLSVMQQSLLLHGVILKHIMHAKAKTTSVSAVRYFLPGRRAGRGVRCPAGTQPAGHRLTVPPGLAQCKVGPLTLHAALPSGDNRKPRDSLDCPSDKANLD